MVFGDTGECSFPLKVVPDVTNNNLANEESKKNSVISSKQTFIANLNIIQEINIVEVTEGDDIDCN